MRIIKCMLLILVVLLVFPESSSSMELIPTDVSPSIQDGAGRVWGLNRDKDLGWWDSSNRMWRMMRLEDGVLSEDSDSSTGEKVKSNFLTFPYHVVNISKGAGDIVCCVWAADITLPLFITRHFGPESRVIGVIPKEMINEKMDIMWKFQSNHMELMCYLDSKENVWLNLSDKTISRMDAGGKLEKMYDAPSISDSNPGGEMVYRAGSGFDRIDSVFEDGMERLFFFQSTRGTTTSPCLRLIRYDKGEFALMPSLTGLSDPKMESIMGLPRSEGPVGITALSIRDEKTAWLTPLRGPRCILDLVTFEVTPAPKTGGLAADDEEVSREADTPAVSLSGSGRTARFKGGIIRANGKDGLLYAHEGVAEAQAVDWRKGLPLTSIKKVFTLPDGQVLMAGSGGRTEPLLNGEGVVQIDPAILASLTSTKKPLENMLVFDMAQTSDKRIWVLKGVGEKHKWDGKVSVWDGAEWREFAVPLKCDDIQRPHLQRDIKERLWVAEVFSLDGYPVAVYDTAQESWTEHEDLRACFEAYKTDMSGAIFDSQPLHAIPYCKRVHISGDITTPWFSGDGRILIQRSLKPFYYDGVVWRELSLREDVFGGAEPKGVFLTEAGAVAAVFDNNTSGRAIREIWVMPELGRWEKKPDLAPRYSAPELRTAAMGFPVDDNPFREERGVMDNNGVWWAWQKEPRLRCWKSGVVSDGIPAGYENPFKLSRHPGLVFADAVGKIFVKTGDELYIIPAVK